MKTEKIQNNIDIMRQDREKQKADNEEKLREMFSKRINDLFEQYGLIQDRKLTRFKQEIATTTHTTERTISDYIQGKKPCSPAALVAIADYFKDKPDKDGNKNTISIDYLLGRTAHTSMDNEYIYDVTGLSDKAIDKLRQMNKVDRTFRYYVANGAPAWNSVFMALKVPAISAMICSRKFIDFITAFKQYTWAEYFNNIAIKQDGEYFNFDGELVLTSEDPEDNIPLTINESFRKAVALKQIDESIMDISKSCSKNMEPYCDWYKPIYYAEKIKSDKQKRKKKSK